MVMENTWIELTESDLQKIEKRVKRELANLDRHISFLERSADNAWENPNAEENSEKFLTAITDANARKELMYSLVESLSNSKVILQQIKNK